MLKNKGLDLGLTSYDDLFETDQSIPQKRLSEATGLSKQTISRNLHRLSDNGYLEIVPQYNEYGSRLPNKYILK